MKIDLLHGLYSTLLMLIVVWIMIYYLHEMESGLRKRDKLLQKVILIQIIKWVIYLIVVVGAYEKYFSI